MQNLTSCAISAGQLELASSLIQSLIHISEWQERCVGQRRTKTTPGECRDR
jgi:hypothetical protein